MMLTIAPNTGGDEPPRRGGHVARSSPQAVVTHRVIDHTVHGEDRTTRRVRTRIRVWWWWWWFAFSQAPTLRSGAGVSISHNDRTISRSATRCATSKWGGLWNWKGCGTLWERPRDGLCASVPVRTPDVHRTEDAGCEGVDAGVVCT